MGKLQCPVSQSHTAIAADLSAGTPDYLSCFPEFLRNVLELTCYPQVQAVYPWILR